MGSEASLSKQGPRINCILMKKLDKLKDCGKFGGQNLALWKYDVEISF